ncbi:N-acetylneuraminate 9-O-acetyltransferase-like [Amphibalanus amphitrite]|uniref:N-acetylneuraminate 9-O-acetyltransferase-like n=1 Tax=Amphibalanus amphitrite TaxID=1232801 RepID=UPI001C9262CD|nr:N-acetylneuraminate 9-O-acetyltransferase-like [Amphibalanus amphitrite]
MTFSPANIRSQTSQEDCSGPPPSEPTRPGLTHALLHRCNAATARSVAVALVLFFISYHGLVRVVYGTDSCDWLLARGEYHAEAWQPYGCMVHTYSVRDSRRCMRYLEFLGQRNRIAFVGDSRVRQLYAAFVGQFGETVPPPEGEDRHKDIAYEDAQLGLHVQFLWRPMADEKMRGDVIKWRDASSDQLPQLLVLGSATHAIKNLNGSELAVKVYERNVTRLGAVLDQLVGAGTRVLWTIQEPVFYDRLSEERRAITNQQIDLYNWAARRALSSTRVRLWESSRLVGSGRLSESRDGLHAGPRAQGHTVQILMNLYCNDRMNYNDGTCCNSGEPMTALQIVTFVGFGCCIAASAALAMLAWVRKRRQPRQRNAGREAATPQPPSQAKTLVTTLARLGVIMAYFFLCDRTTFFMKENRYFASLNFWLPLGYLVVLGLFFNEESRHANMLHRDQTDEWKGWMQLTILVYHMTAASKVLPIYMHIRVLVSSYLFLTGYGHFMLFWKTGQADLVRFFKVVFRMNMLTVTLCFCMNRPYQFYYFVPLVTFWYVMLYIMLVIPPRVTAKSSENNHIQYLYMVIKFVVFFSIIVILFMSEVFFEKIFVMRPWKALYVTEDDDIHQWWFRWQLDRFSVGYGMVFAFLYVLARRHLPLDDNSPGNLLSGNLALTAAFLSLAGLGVYSTFTFMCSSKPDCNRVHPYIVFIPILSFIVLRNMVGLLRTRYSSLFAWFGRISLELFIGQYHIWLAANTYGVLVLVPLYPVLNVLITTFIFVCVSLEVHNITNELAPVLVPSDWRLCVRNCVIFILILVPIGVHDGMF